MKLEANNVLLIIIYFFLITIDNLNVTNVDIYVECIHIKICESVI